MLLQTRDTKGTPNTHYTLYVISWENSMSRIKQTQFGPFTVVIMPI